MMGKKLASKVLFIFLLLQITSCVETTFATGFFTYHSLKSERKPKQLSSDMKTARSIKNYLKQSMFCDGFQDVSVSVMENRALLTGAVINSECKNRAMDIVWKNNKVKEVINELEIGNGRETFIADANIKTNSIIRLVANPNTYIVNYKVIVYNKKVYLFGIALDDDEIKKATKTISRIPTTKEVVSHLVLVNDDRRDKYL